MEQDIKKERRKRNLDEARTDVSNELLANAQTHLRTGKRGRKGRGRSQKSTRALFYLLRICFRCSVSLTLLSRTSQEFCWRL